MAYTLTDRQEDSYTETIAIYGGDLQSGTAADGGAKDITTPALLASGVPALLHQSPQNVATGAMGRSNVDIALTLDKIKLPAGSFQPEGEDPTPIVPRDGMYFKLTGPADHPDLNQFWAFQGNGRVTPSRGDREANEQVFFCKPVPDPTAVPS